MGRNVRRRSARGARLLRGALAALAIAVLLAPAGAAGKNPTVNTNFFRPAVHPGSLLGVETMLMAEPMSWGVGAWFTWSHRTVRLENQLGTDVYQIVRDLVVADVYGHFAPTKWLDIGLDVPVFLWSRGDSPPAYLPLQPASGASLSDLRLGLKFRVLGRNGDGFGLVFTEDLTFPTATDDDFGGDRYVTSTTLAVGGFSKRGWNVALNAGVRLKAPVKVLNVTTDHQLLVGLGLSAPILCGRLEAVGTAELRTRLTAPFQSAQHDALDLLAGLRGRVGPVVLTVAGGAGVLGGYGTPLGRATVQVAYAPMPDAGCVPDTDGDGLNDAEDRCQLQAGPTSLGGCPDRDRDGVGDDLDACPDSPGRDLGVAATRGCPDGDRDGDGVRDRDDRCPDAPGVNQGDPARLGCPAEADRDRDGIRDLEDRCPDVPGVSAGEPGRLGCPPDRDGDGVPDGLDACPDRAGMASTDPAVNGCASDRDRDGIGDGVDACPDVAGPRSGEPGRNGCPPDRDGDGVIDALDMCPDIHGTSMAEGAQLGCPPDRDRDGVLDPLDACPDTPGLAVADDPTRNGCPPLMVKGAVVILEKVEFDLDSFRLRDESLPVLVTVARLLKDRPFIERVRVAGHTDNRFTREHNQWLSDKRAEVVREFLIRQGVAAGRLTAKGFGESRPLGDNGTEEGQQLNRRVEFQVLEGDE